MADIIITGSRGFIGKAIRKALNQPYKEVDLTLSNNHKDLKGCTGTLIYLSAWINEPESFIEPVKYIDNNLRDLALILTNNSFDKVIFPSSMAVYDKDGNLEPDSVYGVTKLAGEKLIKIYCKNYWILRIANPYGLNDRNSVFYKLAQCKLNDQVFTIYKGNGIRKDFFPVEHIAMIVNKIINNEIPSGIYNVGSGKGAVVTDLLQSLCVEHDIKHEYIDTPDGLSAGYIPFENLLASTPKEIQKEWVNYLS